MENKLLIGINDLQTKNLTVEKKDYDKNDIKQTKVSKGSQKVDWWKCIKGYEWKATIASRACNSTRCPMHHKELVKKILVCNI